MKSIVAKLPALPAALVLALSSGASLAVHESEFSRLDTNQDGYISRDEASGKLVDEYASADHDEDGLVDQSEFSAFEARMDDFTDPVTGPGGVGITESYESERVE